MTFVLVAANGDQLIQVSDRRLTLSNGAVLTEASGKAGHLLCDDASALYGFTGLAKIRAFDTSTWLMEALQAASKRNARFRELIEHFAEIATEQFGTNLDILSVGSEHRRLTVMLSAYTAGGYIVNALISNFQDFFGFVNHPKALPAFTVHCWASVTPASENPTFVQAIGAFRAMTDQDERELRALLEKRAPFAAIREKAASIVRSISTRHRSGGTVGQRLSMGRIDYTSPMHAYVAYDSDVVEGAMPTLAMVDGRSEGTGLIIGEAILSTDGPMVFPNVHRNAPCLLAPVQSRSAGGADENLDYLEIVHVFIRRPYPSGHALHQAGQAHRGDYPPVGLSDEELFEELA